jgi:GT2 family glycosyltransferase
LAIETTASGAGEPRADDGRERARPLISVVVPVRDNPSGLRELLARLEAQTLSRDRFEVVIGDDGSAEKEPGAIESGDGWVRVVRSPARTSYAARNEAVHAARGSMLAFCDSDCLPEPNWLEAGLAALDGDEIVAGQVAFVVPARPTVWSLLTIDMFFDQERNVRLLRGVTANLFVTRRLFEDLEGFDDSLPSGGDYDFVRRALDRGARLTYAPTAVVMHPTIDTAGPFLAKIWTTNRWYAVRRARARAHLSLAGALELVPLVGVALARRHALRPVATLYRPRLAAARVEPDRLATLRAVALLYLVVAPVAGLGRAQGWLGGLRATRRQRGLGASDSVRPSPGRAEPVKARGE